jgi:ubiquinone/menaquinone biosynthesis C-methylase UbiE
MEAHGVDLDPGMLRLGGGAPSLPGPGSVSFYRGDAAQLPFPDGVFDFVTVSLALHDKSRAERGRVVEEMRRVAKPGATLVFTDFQVPLPRNPVALAARVIEFCAGGDHYAGFRDYLKSGDLDGFIHSRGLRPLRSRTAVGGLLVMIAARPEETA